MTLVPIQFYTIIIGIAGWIKSQISSTVCLEYVSYFILFHLRFFDGIILIFLQRMLRSKILLQKSGVGLEKRGLRLKQPFVPPAQTKYVLPTWAPARLKNLNSQIHDELSNSSTHPKFADKVASAKNYFDGSGKQIRPLMILMMSRFLEATSAKNPDMIQNHERVAITAEMIHTASLMHDDVLDEAESRRSKQTLNAEFDDRNAILIGNFVVGEGMKILAGTNNSQVIAAVTKSMHDLIEGELLQMAAKDDPMDLNLYIDKTFLKTGSLMANSLKAVAILSQPENEILHQKIYQFGKSIGIAFQIIDDCLDFTSYEVDTGKPSQGADIKLGLITAPVIFAAKSNTTIEAYIKSGFKNSKTGEIDQAQVDYTVKFVQTSGAILQSKKLADIYIADGLNELRSCFQFVNHSDISEIEELVQFILSRNK